MNTPRVNHTQRSSVKYGSGGEPRGGKVKKGVNGKGDRDRGMDDRDGKGEKKGESG